MVASTDNTIPEPLYDPVTGDLMIDPVVNPAGDSYERSTLEGSDVTYYPNRALQSIIQRTIELESDSLHGALRRVNESLQTELARFLEATLGIERHPLHEAFYCPITHELICDPVITPDGVSYEYEAIAQWIQSRGQSPVSRTPLSLNDLRDNNALYELIQLEKHRSVDSIHPSIRRWKASGSTSRRARNSHHVETGSVSSSNA